MRKLILNGAAPKEFAIAGEVTIGAQAANKVVLQGPKVSANHAKVSKVGEHTFIEDLNSGSGVLVNGKKTTRAALKKGDKIDIGGVLLTYDDDGKPDAPPAKPAAAAPAKPAAGKTSVLPAKTPAPQPAAKGTTGPVPTKTPLPQPAAKANTAPVPTKPPGSITGRHAAVGTPASQTGRHAPVPTPSHQAAIKQSGPLKPLGPGASTSRPAVSQSLTATPARTSGSLTPPKSAPVPTTGIGGSAAGASAAKMIAAGNTAIMVRGKTASAVASTASAQRMAAEAQAPSLAKKVLVAGGAGVVILGMLLVAMLIFGKSADEAPPGISPAEHQALGRLKTQALKDPQDLKLARRAIFDMKKWPEVEAVLGAPQVTVPGKIMLWDQDQGTSTLAGAEFRGYHINDSLAPRDDSQVVSMLLFEVDGGAVKCLGMRIHALKETPPLAKAMGDKAEYEAYLVRKAKYDKEQEEREKREKEEQEKRAAEEKKKAEQKPNEPEQPAPAPTQPQATK